MQLTYSKVKKSTFLGFKKDRVFLNLHAIERPTTPAQTPPPPQNIEVNFFCNQRRGVFDVKFYAQIQARI